MNVFTDAVNESFGYAELAIDGTQFLVDFNDKNSVYKMVQLAGDNLQEVLATITVFPKDTLYRIMKEETALGHYVIYNSAQFYEDTVWLSAKEDLGLHIKPEQPIGMSTTEHLFSNSEAVEIDLEHWDVSEIVFFDAMFAYCDSLRELHCHSWNTRKATSMISMFEDCSVLQLVDLSNWDFSSVECMFSMFLNCACLVRL